MTYYTDFTEVARDGHIIRTPAIFKTNDNGETYRVAIYEDYDEAYDLSESYNTREEYELLNQNAHVKEFWRSPLSQRADWVRIKISEIEAQINGPGFDSPHAYYTAKDKLREYRAALKGKNSWEYDPMDYHFGMMSN